MIDRMVAKVPEPWRGVVDLAMAPVAWLPRMQQALTDFFLESSSPWAASAKYVFLLFPLLLATAAVWCTQLSLYTLPFRAARSRFVSMMLLAWWDAALAVWLYWVGLARFGVVAAGWTLALGRLAVRLAAALVGHLGRAPAALAHGYVPAGFPWVALAVLLAWCGLEAAVFTYTLLPTIADVLADTLGTDDVSRLTAPILYVILFVLIAGSFACVHALADALGRRERRFLAQIVLVQVSVLFVEVVFFYRDLVDALAPWVAQETGVRLGLASTLLLAIVAWIGIRGMTWLLFGQYGAPSLLALIARPPRALADTDTAPVDRTWWRPSMDELRDELASLHRRSDELLEYLALPVLHLLGSAVNFATILTAGRPAFALPFKGLKEATEQRELLATAHLEPRKQTTL